jgi:hypothetical protein
MMMRSTHPQSVIAGLDPAISIRMHGASIIEIAGTSPAITIPSERIMYREAGAAGD